MPRGNPAITRVKLLQAGQRLSGHTALSRLRVDDIVAKAGVAKGTFYLHFESLPDFLAALHRDFHDAVADEVEVASGRQPPGLRRLLAGSLAYLDACRRRGAVKALLLESHFEPAVQSEVRKQNIRFAALAEKDFAAASWPAPAQAAWLWVGMLAAAAAAESDAGRALSAARKALPRFLGLDG